MSYKEIKLNKKSSEVILEVGEERQRQIDLGWTQTHDAVEGAGHIVREARIRLNRFGNNGEDLAKTYQRQLLIEAAALLVAAAEVL